MEKLDRAYRIFLSVMMGVLTAIAVVPFLFIIFVVIWAVFSV